MKFILINLFKKRSQNTNILDFDDVDKEILLYVYKKSRLESDATLTTHQLYRAISLDSPVLINSRVTRLVIDGYLRKSTDTKDIRFTYVNITNLGIETLKKLRLINTVTSNL